MRVQDRPPSSTGIRDGARNAAVSAPDVLTALRQTTETVHARLDSRLPLARADATLADYMVHVAAIGGWLAALSPIVGVPGGPASTAGLQGPRLQAVQEDMRDGGAPPVADERDDTDAVAALLRDARTTPAVAWGIAYVIEGSQLGGRMLHRRLGEALAPHPLRYLSGVGASGRWPAFTAELRAAVQGAGSMEAACRGAVATFDLLVRRFNRLGVPA